MATESASAESPQSTPNPVASQGAKASSTAPGIGRRHSLPLHFLPPGLWSANASTASLIESEEAARGEHILDERTVATRISALRQLNGGTRGHRYTKSTGARSSTFSQPVIVRTYSGTARPRSQKRDLVTVKKESGLPAMKSAQAELKLPPVEAFTFKGIMDEIRHGVTDDLERIAEICARSRYSLSNQYEVHMPPHGQGEAIMGGLGGNGGGPTLQAISSDDEQTRHVRRSGPRRTRSAAYGTLETIMSSSRSSDEDKSKKKPAAELAEEVRGRAAKKLLRSKNKDAEEAVDAEPSQESPQKRVRSKSASFASVMIDNAENFRHDTSSTPASPELLISEPARPQTSTADLTSLRTFGEPSKSASPTLQSLMFRRPMWTRPTSSMQRASSDNGPSLLESLSSWLPWIRQPPQVHAPQGKVAGVSHAEGSLRDLLRFTESDPKGKSVDRS
jgi:hypothetical protein